MTVSIQVTTNQKDPVYKPPPPTVAKPAASTATASAVLAPRPTSHKTPLTPIHSLVKDLLQRQRLVLSWSSLRLIISRGIYPSSSFLTTPGSTSLPSLPSTQAYYSKAGTGIKSGGPQQQQLPTETTPALPSPIAASSVPPTLSTDSSHCTRSPSSPDSQRSGDQDRQQRHCIATTTTENLTPPKTVVKTMSAGINIVSSVETKTNPKMATTPATIDSGDSPLSTKDYEELQNKVVSEPSSTSTPALSVNEDAPTTIMDVESSLTEEVVLPLTDIATLEASSSLVSGNIHQHENSTNMETDLPHDKDPAILPSYTATSEESVPASALVDETSLFTEPVSVSAAWPMLDPQPRPSTSTDSIMGESQSPISSSAPLPLPSPNLVSAASLTNEPQTPSVTSTILQPQLQPRPSTSTDSIMEECQSSITSSTPLPRPSPTSASAHLLTNECQSTPITSETSLVCPPLATPPSSETTSTNQSPFTSSTPLPRPSLVSPPSSESTCSTGDSSQSPITSSTLLPRPSRTVNVPSSLNGSKQSQRPEDTMMDICESPSPINANVPLPRPSVLSRSTSINKKANTAPAPLRNSTPPIPPKRNSKLPIRASSSTPSGLLSSKRPAALPSTNKRRAIPSLFSPSNPTPVPASTASSSSGTKAVSNNSTNTTRSLTQPLPAPSPATKILLTKMDHVLPTHDDNDDEEEEERPKPISRKEKLARQAKRAEQIKFYRVREEREAREQRLAARRRLMAPKSRTTASNSNSDVSDSGSTSSSSSSSKRPKGVKFNLNRNRVIEIKQAEHPSARTQSPSNSNSDSSSRIPHSIR